MNRLNYRNTFALKYSSSLILRSNPIDDSTVLYHPIEEEIVKAIASGIDVDDFVAQFVSMDMQSSASMLRRRYHKIAHLLSIYQAYSQPPMQINLDGKI